MDWLKLILHYYYFMARSQETFLKKQREKERARKKKMKQEKKEQRRENYSSGPQIDWSSAPENRTLSKEEENQKQNIKVNNQNK